MQGNEKRRAERRNFTYYMRVTDAASGVLIGHLVDISSNGFQLDCGKALPIGKEFRMYLDLTGEISNKSSITFSARSVWVRPDPLDPTNYKVGFQVLVMGSNDAAIFYRMFENYASLKPKR